MTTTLSGTDAAVPQPAAALEPLRDLDATLAQAEAQGTPSERNATSILATGGDYLVAGQRAAEGLGQLIDRRQQKLDRLNAAGGDQQQIGFEREQIELLTKLRERIQESVERVRQILLERSQSDDDIVLRRRQRAQQAEQTLHDLQRQVEVPPPEAAVAARSYTG